MLHSEKCSTYVTYGSTKSGNSCSPGDVLAHLRCKCCRRSTMQLTDPEDELGNSSITREQNRSKEKEMIRMLDVMDRDIFVKLFR
jgi:hypothetical protein